MNKKKIIIMSIIMVATLLILSTKSFAAEIKATYTCPSNDGTIVVDLSELTLEETGGYQYALTTQSGEEPTEWFDLATRTATTAKIILSGSDTKITPILAKTNDGLIWIKKKDDVNSNAIKVKVDLTPAPETCAGVKIDDLSGGKFVGDDYQSSKIYIGLYNKEDDNYYINSGSYQFIKVTDKNIINEWLGYKNNSTKLDKVTELIKNKNMIPTSGYVKPNFDTFFGSYYISASELRNRKNGLYLLCVSITGDDGCKTVYGYTFYDGLYDTGKTLSDYNITDDGGDKKDETENLTATVKYSTTATTTGSVTATITTNKSVEKVDGWDLSEDGKTLTKTYTENKTETVTLKDSEGKTTTVDIKISNITSKNQTNTSGNSDNSNNSSTNKPSKLPKTGASSTIIALLAVGAISVVVLYKKVKKFDF